MSRCRRAILVCVCVCVCVGVGACDGSGGGAAAVEAGGADAAGPVHGRLRHALQLQGAGRIQEEFLLDGQRHPHI